MWLNLIVSLYQSRYKNKNSITLPVTKDHIISYTDKQGVIEVI
jgi:hypothetical protein